MDDDVLTAHVHDALTRGLPVAGQHPPHAGIAVLVGSGPSVEGQLESIKRQQHMKGRTIFAIKDAHDWLIEHDVIPNSALVIDPTEGQWQCFRKKHPNVTYFVASQCHPSLFDHLAGHSVYLFHLAFNEGKAYPPNTPMICGATTTGLRAITLLYTMGFRRFELYGYDSCLMDGALRVDSAWKREDDELDKALPIVVGDRQFLCTPSMAGQAEEFQKLWVSMPDIYVQSYGDGLLTAILSERDWQTIRTIYTHGRLA